jgi:hypothetical protein
MLAEAVVAVGISAELDRATGSIEVQDLEAHVRFLASDELQGRALGHPGNDIAAAYLASIFERLGLEGEAGYFQRFDAASSALGPSSSLSYPAAAAPVLVGNDFYPLHSSPTATVHAPLVFPEGRDVDVEGKIVVIADTGSHPRPEQHVDAFSQEGAVGLLLVREPLDAGAYWPDAPSPRDEWYFLPSDPSSKLVSARISQRLATELSARDSLTLVSDVIRRPLAARNVVAHVRGAEAGLARDLVVVGAHFDHEGVDAEGRIYNGADDDASGTAGVLEIAEAFSRLAAEGVRPRRTVVFGLWNGEERGRLGSKHYALSPLPREGRPVAYLNLDMIGRNEEVADPGSSSFLGLEPTTASENVNVIHMIGHSLSPELARLVERENQSVGFDIRKERDAEDLGFLRSSDHWSFLERGIPAIFIYTGEHPEVHTPLDDFERLDFPKMRRIVRLAFLVVWSLANQDALP